MYSLWKRRNISLMKICKLGVFLKLFYIILRINEAAIQNKKNL